MKVSAIMPTYNRREFIPLAIKCFESQTYQDKELIVLDDGESVRDLIPSWAKYHRCEKLRVGPKRNKACELASGGIIVHWDDDDWSAPTRIEDQVNRLVKSLESPDSPKAVTGYSTLLFWDGKRAFRYLGDQHHAAGSSLCYFKSWWNNHRFIDVQIGEDGRFSGTAFKAGKLITAKDNGLMVATIHPKNTSARATGSTIFPEVSPSELPDEFPKWRVTP
jgi:glycosyltransferase involved in cell wall biosynthesis